MPAASAHSAPSAWRPRSATCGITSSRTRPSTNRWMLSSMVGWASARPNAFKPSVGNAGRSIRRSRAGLWQAWRCANAAMSWRLVSRPSSWVSLLIPYRSAVASFPRISIPSARMYSVRIVAVAP